MAGPPPVPSDSVSFVLQEIAQRSTFESCQPTDKERIINLYIYLYNYLLFYFLIFELSIFYLNYVLFMGYAYEILELDWFLLVIHDWFLL